MFFISYHPKTPSVLTLEDKILKVSAFKEKTELPALREKKKYGGPFFPSLQNEFIPEEFLLSLTCAASAGPCPENLLYPKKIKTPKGTLLRSAEHVWQQHPIQRTKFRCLNDRPSISLMGTGR